MSPIWKYEKVYSLDWTCFDLCIHLLASSLEDLKFDAVIGIARGGAIPAVALSHRLKISNFTTIQIRRNLSDQSYSFRDTPALLSVIDTDVREKNLLLVDDIIGDGHTMLAALQELKAKDAKSTTSATLALNIGSTYIPDRYAFQIDDWVVFPWEYALVPPGKIVEPVKLVNN